MKKTSYLLSIIMLLMSITVACSSDEGPSIELEKAYEVTSDIQHPMSLFLGSIPEEYAAF